MDQGVKRTLILSYVEAAKRKVGTHLFDCLIYPVEWVVQDRNLIITFHDEEPRTNIQKLEIKINETP